MRHLKAGRKLGRTSSHRWATLRNMVTSLLEHERIETTEAKAKDVRRVAEKMITLGKRGTLHDRRQALKVIRNKEVAKRVFDVLSPRYRSKQGGYTRILKLGRRHGDNAPMSLVELIPEEAKKAGARKRGDASRSRKKKEDSGKGGEKQDQKA
jgi:large subunit ribosomal protein L17